MRLLTITILSLLLLIGCSKEEVTPNEKTEKLLRAQVWELTVTKIDGLVDAKYDGLTLSFGSNTYTTTNGGSLWPSSGTWEFVNKKGNKILRDDGLEITIISVNADQLVMSFYWDKTIYDGGRVNSIEGQHEMTFNRLQ